MSKIVVASFHEDENEMFERVIAALGDNVELEEFSRSPVMQFEKGLNIYPERHQVCITEKMIPLSRHEYDLLYFLARHPGWAFSKKQIFEAVWDMESENLLSTVVNTVSRLRRKIEPDPQEPTYIQTVQGYGYKLAVQPINKD